MKKIIIIAGLLVNAFALPATELLPTTKQSLIAQYNNREQVLIAYYVNGNSLSRIKIKIEAGSVTFFSTGKDPVGNEQWQANIPRGNIVKTHSSIDGDLAREFDYKSTLYIPGYQSRSVTIYF
ncbi:MAG: hypothetical protein K2J82_09955 [Muribaculaceae bacterium]|nr:hypothetical protein [Muribaculaceae bacterium]